MPAKYLEEMKKFFKRMKIQTNTEGSDTTQELCFTATLTPSEKPKF